ncbi:ABC transporter ATP-binding protein [Collinsella stercoris]|uniref:Fatty acid ABC transporter ATP-binding/permease protein n=1 Tax=Collinsella stercoris DSM 13279 TaxID=445975 RepID=B6GDT0_9ACTN|nr:ABC transporter ATP-binding protein [Collinsella stercoris]EEA89547.1 ABC transporter, ATP-binding protein [Collinsella stercoris DSM 13279]UEA45123.1 ABC transporter ATP-binding protein/permease [Collinsella stercoris DSM 13279]UWP12355.1 ABC transporter ATP-binding protein/permease [Collinsella stercoris]
MSKASTAARAKNRKSGTLKRIIKMLFSFYPVLLPLVMAGVLLCGLINSIGSVFLQKALEVISTSWQTGDWTAAQPKILGLVTVLAIIYLIGNLSSLFWNRYMGVVTQGSLEKLREKMFNRMQDLPIRYFDTNQRGDIMSHYTNDIDTLRQMISQSLPNLLQTIIVLATVLGIMFYFSAWMGLVIIAGVAVMTFLTKLLGSNSARFFIAQQMELGVVEGHIEEVMNGQKVVKAFCHERAAEEDFDERNEKLFEVSQKANMFANILMPILMNLGNLIYVMVALAGGVFLALDVPNLSFSGLPFSIAVVVPFLNMTKQFCGQIGQVSQQINAVVMGLAGAERIFELLDQEPEVDEGYVTLVDAQVNPDTWEIEEADHRTGLWAWKHPHKADGTVTYVPLRGDVRMVDVDFGYTPDHEVLHGVSVYAKPGQKVAFVGATGAGKTTITNLINRFYDIADGKIRYDGINVNKIKKADLRRSLGVVLQDVNLFTGTVMDNIRYGKLDATDEECIKAAELAGADDFIRRLPDGYNTMLTGNGSQLSQGQRQLVSIARAAVADPPAMILDEATSSIDTRTEAIVQRGMDALMQGRTTFVIAHRLSTVRNSDVIICLDHGRVIERGTHDELIAKKGYYYQLYTGAFELE